MDTTITDSQEVAIATILYARVSSAEQILEHQITQAEQAGFKFDEVIADHGVSGVSTKLSERPEGKRLFDKLRAGDVLVTRWIDRLGRDYQDVTDVIRGFMRSGIIVKTVINRMTFDGSTSDPIQQAVRDALIAFMAATAQAQAEVTKEAQKAGIARAMADERKYPGRKPTYNRATYEVVRDLLSKNAGASEIARTTGLSRQTVLRIRTDPTAAETALARWGM